jgi:hypothetical protein
MSVIPVEISPDRVIVSSAGFLKATATDDANYIRDRSGQDARAARAGAGYSEGNRSHGSHMETLRHYCFLPPKIPKICPFEKKTPGA